jgi:transketolase
MTNKGRQAVLQRLRRKCLDVRRDIVEMICAGGSGHPGGSLSAVEILTALYFHTMRIRPEQPDWAERDRFVLSKGHAAPALYAVLAERGFFPHAELATFTAPGTRLQKHIDMYRVPGTELSTGSLGQGLSVAVGMALADRIDGKDRRVYVLIGDGESQEGQVWEAAMAAAQLRLNNLIVFLDYNRCQVDGYLPDICSLEPVAEKWKSFGWHVQQLDGHDLTQILGALAVAQTSDQGPHMLIADTVKGKGVSYMENQLAWHSRGLTEKDYCIAMHELDAAQPPTAISGKPTDAVYLPTPQLTPGDALDVTTSDICVPGYSFKVRDVPTSVKD